jgi:ribonuclease HII
LLRYEQECWACGLSRVAGVDEAGRGPLAGPVVAAAFVFSRATAEAAFSGTLARLTDSKQLTAAQRDEFYTILNTCPDAEIGIGIGSVEEIDRLNILRATYLAMHRAVMALPALPERILVDGRPVPGFPVPAKAIVRGDSLSFSIAAASVIAKVTRDRMMLELDALYPQYGFAQHKGYGTTLHLQALFEFGPVPPHRLSFRPVREARAIRCRQAGGDCGQLGLRLGPGAP